MFGLSRLVAYAIVFFMGFGLAIGLFVGIPVAMVASYSFRDLESTNLVNVPDEQYFDLERAEVDLLGLNGIGMYNEFKQLQTFDESELNLNKLEARYGLIFPDKLNKMLTEEARELPLNRLFSMDGVHAILQNVWLGEMQGYQCRINNPDGGDPLEGDPNDENSYWVTSDGRKLVGVENIIADFNLDDFVSGRINTDNILHGDLKLCDFLGYYQDENGVWYDGSDNPIEGLMAHFADCQLDTIDDKINDLELGELLGYTYKDGKWYNSSNELVTGITTVFADCTINEVGDRINEATLGELLCYTKGEDGKWYNSSYEVVKGVTAVFADHPIDEVGDAINDAKIGDLIGYVKLEDGEWYNENEDGTVSKVDGFMNAIAGESISTIGDLFDKLTVGQIISEEKRTGLLSIIPADTCVNNITESVNDAVSNTPLQFFINQNLVDFKEVDSKLDELSVFRNDFIYIPVVAEGDEGYEEFVKSQKYYGGADGGEVVWQPVEVDGQIVGYQVEAWRTQLLSGSFSYIISLMLLQ